MLEVIQDYMLEVIIIVFIIGFVIPFLIKNNIIQNFLDGIWIMMMLIIGIISLLSIKYC